MNKIIKICKANFVILIMSSIVVNAAIVSDNDGSAFVTKAEFDALKSSFNNQIEEYNESIDNKIDGAIASYLAGIKMATPPLNLYDKFCTSESTKPVFLNKLPGTGSSTQTTEVVINSTREHAIKYINNIYFNTSLWHGYSSRSYHWATMDNALYIKSEPSWGTAYSGWKTVIYNNSLELTTANTSVRPGNLASWSYYSSSYGTISTSTKSMKTGANSVSPGTGSAWIYQKLNGQNCLKFYDTSIFVNITADVWAHSYTDCSGIACYLSDNKKGYGTTLTVTANKSATSKYGKSAAGTKYTGTSTNNGCYADILVSKIESNNGNNYLNQIFANKTTCTTSVYAIDEDADLTQSSSTSSKSTSTTTYYDTYFTSNGENLQSNTLSASTFYYYPLTYTTESKKVNTFAIDSVSTLAGSAVYHGQGFPILEFTSEKDKVDLDFKITASSGSANINYMISEKKFVDGEFDTTADIKLNGTVIPGSIKNLTLKLSTKEFKNGDKIWFNCYSSSDGITATLDSVNIR